MQVQDGQTLLFIGDSITDCGRRGLEAPLGDGYVNLFSDMLLHNIHPTNFRGMSEPGAGVGVYRTPLLWGISRTPPYLHDGSAETIEEAIHRHFGEAAQVHNNYNALPQAERDSLMAFLNDL